MDYFILLIVEKRRLKKRLSLTWNWRFFELTNYIPRIRWVGVSKRSVAVPKLKYRIRCHGKNCQINGEPKL